MNYYVFYYALYHKRIFYYANHYLPNSLPMYQFLLYEFFVPLCNSLCVNYCELYCTLYCLRVFYYANYCVHYYIFYCMLYHVLYRVLYCMFYYMYSIVQFSFVLSCADFLLLTSYQFKCFVALLLVCSPNLITFKIYILASI